MDGATLTGAFEHLTRAEYLYIGAAVFVLAFFLFLLLRRQPKNVTAYCTESGQVMVSRSAIVELVQTACGQIKEVSKPQVRIKAKGKKTNFEVRLKLASGGQLRAVEQALQAHLRKALSENLGIENLGRIDIVATGFKSGRLEPTSSVAKKPSEPSSETELEPLTDSAAEPLDEIPEESEEAKNKS